jgi:hypothetical protein
VEFEAIYTAESIDADDFYFVPDPFRREVDPAAVGARLDALLDYFITENLYFSLLSAGQMKGVGGCIVQAVFPAVGWTDPADFLPLCHDRWLLTPLRYWLQAGGRNVALPSRALVKLAVNYYWHGSRYMSKMA